jgi:hypothetical protein
MTEHLAPNWIEHLAPNWIDCVVQQIQLLSNNKDGFAMMTNPVIVICCDSLEK